MANTNLAKVGGVCAILVVLFIVVWIVLSSASGVEENPDNIQAYLEGVPDNAMYSASGWFVMVGLALVIPSALGFYHALRDAKCLSLLALAFSLAGITIALASIGLFIGVEHQLVLGYAAATEAMKPTLAVVASALQEAALWAFLLGFFLSFGIGAVLFGFGALRTSAVRHWIGWLGVIAGVLMICFFLGLISDILENIGRVAFILILIWTAAMGVSLLRLRESPA
jgi:hypothetical protein